MPLETLPWPLGDWPLWGSLATCFESGSSRDPQLMLAPSMVLQWLLWAGATNVPAAVRPSDGGQNSMELGGRGEKAMAKAGDPRLQKHFREDKCLPWCREPRPPGAPRTKGTAAYQAVEGDLEGTQMPWVCHPHWEAAL